MNSIIASDSTSRTKFKLYPLQLLGTLQFSPFASKWLSFDGWGGIERLFHSESRLDSGSDGESYVNKGKKDFIVFGGAANLSLNFISYEATRSLRSMGISDMYFSGYFELSRALGSKEGLKLDRNTFGLAFTFESAT